MLEEAPPGRGACSRRVTCRPARARWIAATRPFDPAPTTTTRRSRLIVSLSRLYAQASSPIGTTPLSAIGSIARSAGTTVLSIRATPPTARSRRRRGDRGRAGQQSWISCDRVSTSVPSRSVPVTARRQSMQRAWLRLSSRPVALALAVYLVVDVAYFGVHVIPDIGQTCACRAGGDPTSYMWFLSWWPHALLHGINPFVTNV